MTDIELTPTEDLVYEIMKRHDESVILINMRTESEAGESGQFYRGNPYAVLGMMAASILDVYFKLSNGEDDDET